MGTMGALQCKHLSKFIAVVGDYRDALLHQQSNTTTFAKASSVFKPGKAWDRWGREVPMQPGLLQTNNIRIVPLKQHKQLKG